MINNTENSLASRNSFQNAKQVSNRQEQKVIVRNVQYSKKDGLKFDNGFEQNRMGNANQTKIPVYNYIPNKDYLQSCRKSRCSQRPDLTNKNFNEKLKCLGKVKYKNQLAQLDYEQKLTELHTKYSKTSKNTSLKKIKAKNQIAEFIDQEDQWNQQFDEIIDYKYGSKNQGFHFEKQETKNQYYFCDRCDQITDDYPEAHSYLCKDFKNQYQIGLKSREQYKLECFERIQEDLNKINESEVRQLKQILNAMKMKKLENTQALDQIQRNTQRAKIIGGICRKLKNYL